MWRDHLGHANVLGAGLNLNITAPIAEVQSPAAMIKVNVHEEPPGGGVPSDINLVQVAAGSFPVPNGAYMPAVLRRRNQTKIWSGDIPVGWWRPDIPNTPPREAFKSLPPKRDEHWIV